MNKSYGAGFQLVSQLQTSGLRYYTPYSGLAIQVGDALEIANGVLVLATTALDITFPGIAYSENTAAQSTAAVKVAVIPPLQHYQFKVKVVATDLITTGQIGATYDLQNEVGIDENDTAIDVWGFFVDEVDVSAEAIAANEYGYVVGHFVNKT